MTRENAVPLEENEYFIADLIGLSVTSDEGEELGVIDDVLQTGANDVYVVKKAGANDLLIPAIKDCILDVDVEKWHDEGASAGRFEIAISQTAKTVK